MLQENGEIVMIKCPKCGKDLPKGARFCPYCMYRFEKSENVVGATTYNINTNMVEDTLIMFLNLMRCRELMLAIF